MEIQISKMSLRNFKGVRSLEINFGHVTTISGENATGKTTIFDAFTWLLFGKNSGDAKDFNIKTLDKDNEPIHKLDHEVTATLSIDGRESTLRRIYREKWVKKKGSETTEFTGHETEFYIDDVPLSQKEYQARVDLLIREDIIKLITNPLYFNQIKWNERRVVLESMAGTVSNIEVLNKITNSENRESILKLSDILNSGKKVDDYKKELGAKKKKIKDELETIPTRIEECDRMMPEAKDFSAIEKKITEKQSEIKTIDSEIENKSKAYEKQYSVIQGDHLKLNNLKVELSKLEQENQSSKATTLAEIDGKIRTAETNLKTDLNNLQSNLNEIQRSKSRIDSLNKENATLRSQWNEENAKALVIDEHKLNCPTCKQALPEDQRNDMQETLTKNFNDAKQTKLSNLNQTGKNNKASIDQLQNASDNLEASNKELEKRTTEIQLSIHNLKQEREEVAGKPVPESPAIAALKKRISEFKISEAPVIDNESLKVRKTELLNEVDVLKSNLSSRDQITKTKTRIAELQGSEKALSQELADLERIEFTIDAFSKAKIEEIESRINGKFSLVKFKMFEQQINGGETECCECMVNGVPFSDVNTASKINAGIDIINALTEHYHINAPVFVDNRESVINLLPCKSQIINLRAEKGIPLTVTHDTELLTKEAA